MMAGIKMKGKNGLFTPASFSHEYRLRTVQQSNDKGTWFGWEVQKIGPVENAEPCTNKQRFLLRAFRKEMSKQSTVKLIKGFIALLIPLGIVATRAGRRELNRPLLIGYGRKIYTDI